MGEEIGRGGMGAVLRAVDQGIRREVAVKFLLSEREGTQKVRFIEEAQITGQLEHPNIVPVHELGVDAQDRCYFAMKLVRGRSLMNVLEQLRTAPEESDWTLSRLLGVFVNVCHAIAYAHSRDVIHRDLKPANIMVGDFGEVYVMDWGLAKVLPPAAGMRQKPVSPDGPTMTHGTTLNDSAGASGNSSTGGVSTTRTADEDLTIDGSILGTPAYMSPEQAAGKTQNIGRASDIYALGAILYELLTLLPPVNRDGGHVAVLRRVIEGQVLPPAKRAPSRARAGQLPKDLAAVAMKALSLRPADRYLSVEALRRDIELFLEGRSVSAKKDTAWETLQKLIRRNKGVSVTLGILIPLLIGVLLYSSVTNYRERLATAKAYQDYKDHVKQSVPAFVRSGRLAADQRRYDDAMSQVELAIAADSDYPDAWLLKAQLLIVRQDFDAAVPALERYTTIHPDSTTAHRLLAACRNVRPDDVGRLLTIAAILHEQQAPSIVDGLLSKYGHSSNEARQFLLKIYREQIEKAWPGKGELLTMDSVGLRLNFASMPDLTDLSPLSGMPLNSFDCSQTGVADLSPLKGMPLTELNCAQTRVTDFRPLQGMQLTSLMMWHTQVQNFAPLKGMPLTVLHCPYAPVTDLSPLAGMPLTTLAIQNTQITNLSPLAGMSLTVFDCSGAPVSDLTPLAGMPLKSLCFNFTQVASLAPLAGMPLIRLEFKDTPVEDVSPLEGMKLTHLSFTPARITHGMEVIRNMKSMLTIGTWDLVAPEKFWKEYDAGQIGPAKENGAR